MGDLYTDDDIGSLRYDGASGYLLDEVTCRTGRVVVYEDQDGFEVIVQLTGDGEILVLIAASPRVWPNGTPEPEAG